MAFHEYANDHEGWLPREGYHTNGLVYWNFWASVYDPQSKDVWYNALAGYVSHPPASSYAWPAGNQTQFYERNSFFHCPSAHFPRCSGGPEVVQFSIAMNSQLIEPPDDMPTILFDRVVKTSQTVLLLDNLLEGEKPVVQEQANDNLGQPAAYANRFAGRRHGRAGVMAFFDGHVDAVPGEKAVATSGDNVGWAILPEKEIRWDPE